MNFYLFELPDKSDQEDLRELTNSLVVTVDNLINAMDKEELESKQ